MQSLSTRPLHMRPSQSNLAATLQDPALRTLLVTATQTGAGTSTSALALAAELARQSAGRVLLIDASLDDQGLSIHYAPRKPGLLDVLAQPALDPLPLIQSPKGLEYDFLPVGNRPVMEGTALPADALQALLNQLGEHYRFIVLDAAPILHHPDVLPIAARVDACVLVVTGDETRWEVAQAAVTRLQQAGARLAGCIFNRRRYPLPHWLYRRL